jgi:hypothetical protein
MQLRSAVLAKRIRELEGVELDIGVAVREALDQGRDGL